MLTPSYGYSLVVTSSDGEKSVGKRCSLQRAPLGDTVEVFGGSSSRDEAVIHRRKKAKHNPRLFQFELRSKQAPGQPGILIDPLMASAHSQLLAQLTDNEQPFEDLKINFLELDWPLRQLEVLAESLYTKILSVRDPEEAVDFLSLGSYLMAPSLQEGMVGYLERCWCSEPDALMDADLALRLWAQVRRARRAVPDEEAKLQEALQRLDRQALAFVHSNFQGLAEVPPGLTLSDIDALLGSADLACDDESRVLWFLEEWHETREEPLNIGLVLMHVKLEFLEEADLFKLPSSIPKAQPELEELESCLDAWARFRSTVPFHLNRMNAADSDAVSALQSRLRPARPRSPVFPFNFTFRVQNLAELYSEGQAQANGTLLPFDFRSPVPTLNSASSFPKLALFPYGHGLADWISHSKLSVGYNFDAVAEKVSLISEGLLDGSPFGFQGSGFNGKNAVLSSKPPYCTVVHMPLKNGKPEGLRESGTLVFKLTVTGIKPRLDTPAKRPEPEEGLIRALLGPLAAHFFPEAEAGGAAPEEAEGEGKDSKDGPGEDGGDQ